MKKQRNQCDGCAAGIPVDKHGHHHVPYPSGGMVCQAPKYGHAIPYPAEVQKQRDAGFRAGFDLLEQSKMTFDDFRKVVDSDRSFEEDGR